MEILMGLLFLNIVLALAIRQKSNSSYYKKMFLFIMFGAMTIIAGFRGITVGIDTSNYALMYNSIRDGGLATLFQLSVQYEWGFMLLAYLLSRVFSSSVTFFFTCALVINGLFARVFYKYSKDVAISTFLFIIWFFPSTMNTMRQYMALAIVLLALQYIEKKEPLKYLFIVFIATSIHTTASIFFVLFIFTIKKIRVNIKTVAIAAIASMVALNFFDFILNLFFKYFSQYQRFMSSSKYTSQSTVSRGWILFYVFTAILFAFAIYREEKHSTVEMFLNDKIENDRVFSLFEIEYLFCILYIISIICMVFSSKLWIATRINSYFRFSICLIMPVVMRFIDQYIGRFRLFTYFGFYVIFGYFGHSMFLMDGHRLLPFVFF